MQHLTEPTLTAGEHAQAPLHHTTEVAEPFVRQDAAQLAGLSDKELRQYEAVCFDLFQSSPDKNTKDEWIHALAGALVEMTNRGLSLGAKA